MKRILLLTAAVLMAMGMEAKQVEVNKAKSIAQQFLLGKSSASTTRTAVSNDGLNLVYTATTNNGEQTTRATEVDGNLFYVFSQSDSKGFVIVAADDAVSPILAYSRENGFNGDNIPCNVKAVLDNYRAAITGAIANGKDASEEWSDVGTRAEETVDGKYLLESKWNQSYPYNQQAPTLGGKHCVTGCVATAMAQIMYYWKHPIAGNGKYEYYWKAGEQTLSANFTEPFNWEQMHDTYDSNSPYSQEEIDAISHLMRQCGVSLSMAYYNQSAASINIAMQSLKEYFNYSPKTIKYCSVANIGDEEWIKLIKKEINEGRPMLYSSIDHAYICDGYQEGNYLHLNFGWGGYGDGFYKFMDSDYLLSSYLNQKYQDVVYGIVPTDMDHSDPPAINVYLEKFACEAETDTLESGSLVNFRIGIGREYGDETDIDEYGLVSVDDKNDVLSVLGTLEFEFKSHGVGFETSITAINLCNRGTDVKEIKIMPAYKHDGKWVVITKAKPIVKKINPIRILTESPSIVANTYYKNFQSQVKTNLGLNIFLPEKEAFFCGKVYARITDNNGEEKRAKVFDVAHCGSTTIPLSFAHTFDKTGTYTLSLSAKDTDDNDVALRTSTFTLTVSEEPSAPYCSYFNYDPDKYGDFFEIYGAYSPFPFAENTDICIKASYSNPTNDDVTKTISLTNSENKVMDEKTIKIPAKGKCDLKMKFTALAGDASYLYLKEKVEDGNGGYKYYQSRRNPANETFSNLIYRVEKPAMTFTSAPTTDNNHTLKIYANQEQWIYCTCTTSLTSGSSYSLVARLFKDDALVAECKNRLFTNFEDGNFPWILKGFNVSPGAYTLKFVLSLYGIDEFDITDIDGKPVAYNVTIDSLDMSLQEYDHVLNGVNYMFSANSEDLHYGETFKLRFSLKNPNQYDFDGTIMVKDFNAGTTCTLQSEEKPISIAASKATYGEIGVTVPISGSNNTNMYGLYAKRKNDNEYKYIDNTKISLNITNGTDINSVTLDNCINLVHRTLITGATINEAKVYDVSGREVYGFTIGDKSIDLQPLPKGIYIVDIDMTGRIERIKIAL